VTRRRFITAPPAPDDAERFVRALAGRPVEPEPEPEPTPMPVPQPEPEQKRPVPPAPHGAREPFTRPGNDADAFLRAMSHAAITGDPDWITKLDPGWQPA
jgi:hypothetical protein